MSSSTLVSDRLFYSRHGAPFFAPLFLEPESGASSRRGNFRESFVRRWTERLGGRTDVSNPRGIFHWIYAVVHSPTYRRRHDEMLRIDFPRVPLPDNASRLHAWSRLGRKLVDLHVQLAGGVSIDVQSPAAEGPAVTLARGYPRWESPDRLMLGPDRPFDRPVGEPVWRFRLGGHAVIERWLKQRRARGLSAAESAYLAELIRVVEQTLRLVNQIDRLAWDFT